MERPKTDKSMDACRQVVHSCPVDADGVAWELAQLCHRREVRGYKETLSAPTGLVGGQCNSLKGDKYKGMGSE
jgi:hypothetical protein